MLMVIYHLKLLFKLITNSLNFTAINSINALLTALKLQTLNLLTLYFMLNEAA